ncbi:glycosyltransferase [Sphingomonas mollis]
MADTMPAVGLTTLMLVLPLPIFCDGDACVIDRQAHNGIRRWLDNFDRLILCMPELPAADASADVSPLLKDDFGGRCRLVRLPDHRQPVPFMKVLGTTTKQLDALIDESTHLCFAIGGLFGDWAAVAALRAAKKGRKAAIWTDRVESEVLGFTASQATGLRKVYWSATAWAMRHYERLVIRRSALGLFHGADCFAAYAAYSPDPHLVHDIHLSEDSRISPAELDAKTRRSGPLSIIYAGRAHPDKGVLEWVETLNLLAHAGVDYQATWYGDGPQFDEARRAVSAAGLEGSIAFPGPLRDRDALMRHMRAADIFLFCHKTPESPRCLVEALISGTPIVGYDSSYPDDLIKEHRGGVLTEGNPVALARALETLAKDRERLATLTRAAAADGYPFTDVHVFRHRSDLIKAAS